MGKVSYRIYRVSGDGWALGVENVKKRVLFNMKEKLAGFCIPYNID